MYSTGRRCRDLATANSSSPERKAAETSREPIQPLQHPCILLLGSVRQQLVDCGRERMDSGGLFRLNKDHSVLRGPKQKKISERLTQGRMQFHGFMLNHDNSLETPETVREQSASLAPTPGSPRPKSPPSTRLPRSDAQVKLHRPGQLNESLPCDWLIRFLHHRAV